MPSRSMRAAAPSGSEGGIRPMTENSRTLKPERLSGFVKPLSALSATMLYLAEAGNDRLTINQAAFFLIAAAGDARGVPLTVTEILEGAEGIINPSIANTYKVFLEPDNYRGIGLGWLVREPDPDDERRKYLRLTPKGAAVVKASALALGQMPAPENDE